jgi:hypothetical protein
LRDGGVSILAQKLGSTKLQKLTLDNNSITSTGVSVLLEAMEQSSHHIPDLDLQRNPLVGNEGAMLLARSLGNNALPNLTCLSLSYCGIEDDGLIALLLALEQNASLLQLDLRHSHDPGFSEQAFLALAKSLPEIKVLQRIDFSWCTGLASAMPLVLAGLRENTSLFRFHVTGCAPFSFSRTRKEMKRCARGSMQEMERFGYRNQCLSLIRTPEETHQPCGIWPHALARVAPYAEDIFQMLHSKPKLLSPEDTGGGEMAQVPAPRRNASSVTSESS